MPSLRLVGFLRNVVSNVSLLKERTFAEKVVVYSQDMGRFALPDCEDVYYSLSGPWYHWHGPVGQRLVIHFSEHKSLSVESSLRAGIWV